MSPPPPPNPPGLRDEPSCSAADGRDLSQYECDSCGACCKTWRVLVSETDARREPRIPRESKHLPDPQGSVLWRFQLFPLPFHAACCFLQQDNRCDIYPTRPQVCRNFTAGSDRCQEARALNGLPLLAPASGRGSAVVFSEPTGIANPPMPM